MPLFLGQLAKAVVWSLVNVSCIFGFCISLFKMLFVVHFDVIFNQNPETLGRLVLFLALLGGVFPNIVIYVLEFNDGNKIMPAVAYFTGVPPTYKGLLPTHIYGLFWFFTSIVTLLFAVAFIPYYLRKNILPEILAAESHKQAVKSIQLGRILLSSSGIALVVALNLILQHMELTGAFPIQVLIAVILILIQFLFFLLDANVKMYVKKKFCATFHDSQESGWKRLLCGLCHQRVHSSDNART